MAGTVKKLQFSEGTDVGAPVDLSLATSTTVISAFANDAAYVTSEGPAIEGSVYVNTTLNAFRLYASGQWRTCWVEQDPADHTKLLVKDLSGQTTGVTVTIASVATANRTQTLPDKAGQFALWGAGQALDAPAAGNASIGANVGANNLTLGGTSTTTVIPGNLTVQGTTTQVDTTNLNVKDQNILINDGGNDASAEGAGLTVERTGTNGSLVYEDALASKFKGGALGSESEFITATHVQTIENKRVRLETTAAANNTTSPRLILPSNTLANLQAISGANHVAEGAVYWATDVNSAYIWDGSNLVPVGSGSGAGELNLIENPSAANAIDGWVASGAGITVARTTTSSDLPLEPVIDTAIKITPVSGTDYVRYRFTAPAAMNAEKIKIEWHQRALSGYASGDLKVELYKNTLSDYTGTYTKYALSTDSSGVTGIPNKSGRFRTTTDLDGNSYLELRIVRVSGTTACNFTNVVVGYGSASSAPIVSAPQSFTPVWTNMVPSGTNSAHTWMRVGEYMQIQVAEDITSGSGGAITMEIPEGLNVNTAYSASPTDAGAQFGKGIWVNSGAFDDLSVTLGGVTDTISFVRSNGSALIGTNVNPGDNINFSVMIPILEWSGGGTMNVAENAIEYAFNTDLTNANDTTSFGYGVLGGEFPNVSASQKNKRVRFLSPILPGDKVVIETSMDSGATWQEVTDNSNTNGFVEQAGTLYGMWQVPVNETDVDIAFGNHRKADSATYGGGGSNWSEIDADPQYRWRVKKTNAAEALGFQEASPTATGLAGPSGKYTPGISSTTNVAASTIYDLFYFKIGKIVYVQGLIDIDPTLAATSTIFHLSLPLSSNFTVAEDLSGILTAAGQNIIGQVIGDPASDDALFVYTPGVATNQSLNFNFTYEIK